MKAKRWHECSTKMELKTKPPKWMKQEYAGAKKQKIGKCWTGQFQ